MISLDNCNLITFSFLFCFKKCVCFLLMVEMVESFSQLNTVYVCMYDPLFTRKFFTDASLINVQLVSMRGVGIIKRTIYKNISNYKTIY